jgi:hypothetical protein
MANPRRGEISRGSQAERRHRVRILSTLLGVCQSIERMAVSAAAREACRQIEGQLADQLRREARPRL